MPLPYRFRWLRIGKVGRNWAGPGDDVLRKRLQALNHDLPVIMYFDYHPLNVLTDGRSITCVLDWPNTLVGDRRADLARTFTMLRMPMPSPLLRLGQRILQIALRRGYEQVAGPQGDLRIFYAWAGAGMIYDLAPKDRERRRVVDALHS